MTAKLLSKTCEEATELEKLLYRIWAIINNDADIRDKLNKALTESSDEADVEIREILKRSWVSLRDYAKLLDEIAEETEIDWPPKCISKQ